MKKILIPWLILFLLGFSLNTYAQIFDKLKNKIKQKVEQRADSKTDKAIDNTLDNAEGKSEKNGSIAKVQSKNNTTSAEAGNEDMKTYSKFDFVPGNKILYADDYAQDAIGEFPLNWNTNGMGEIVTIDKLPGKWLKLNKSSKYVSGFKGKLPENATIEFDLIAHYSRENGIPPYVKFTIFNFKGGNPNEALADGLPGFEIYFRFNIGSAQESGDIVVSSRDAEGHNYFSGQEVKNGVFSRLNGLNKPVHIALWIQKERVRIWLNEKKVFDGPKVIPSGLVLNQMRLEEYGQTSIGGSEYFASNFKLAEASADTRSKLITEGKWSTTGILFDVNDDKIKPSSAGVLKDIAHILTENPSVRVKIIGHTDSDGEASKNIELSKKRALSVKAALANDFGIETTRMETDGMGGSKPVADNNSPVGKALNRRVEFVKL
ncbi:MAG: hypothetical protein NVS1B13_09090 [Flavisolibacter sp.]